MSKHDDQDRALLPFDEGDGNETPGRLIRRQWYDGRWFFSVIDVVGLLTESAEPRFYWANMKRRIQAEGFRELLSKCQQLKMRSLDGKMRETDAADVETMLRIVQNIPSPKAEPVKQWLARVGTERLEQIAESDALAGLSEDHKRLVIRGQLAEHNHQLADTAAGAGVLTSKNFAIFQDWGYRGLYAGETARDIGVRKELAKGEKLLDWMGSEELALNFVRSTQAEAKLRREGVTGKSEANQTHFGVGREVREMVTRLGGTMAEDLPTPADSIKQLQRHEQKRIEAERQPSLFADDMPTEGTDDDH